MDKLICTLMTFVVLCVLPKYCDLRSVKDSLNYDVMDGMKNGADLLKLKKRHSITNDKKVPVVQPRLQKQIQQDEKTIKKSVKQNIKTGKQDVQKQETKTRSSDSTSLQHPAKHTVQNPKVIQHKIKPRQDLEDESEDEDDGFEDEDDADFEDVDSEVLAKKKVVIEKQDKNKVNKNTKPKGTSEGNTVKAKPAKPVGRTKPVISPEEKKAPAAPIEVAEVCEEQAPVPKTKKVAVKSIKASVNSKGSHKKH